MLEQKQSLIQSYQIHKEDTGSKRVQVFLLQRKIIHLELHLSRYKNDKDAIEALFRLMNRKRKILKKIRFFNKMEYDSIVFRIDKLKKDSKMNQS